MSCFARLPQLQWHQTFREPVRHGKAQHCGYMCRPMQAMVGMEVLAPALNRTSQLLSVIVVAAANGGSSLYDLHMARAQAEAKSHLKQSTVHLARGMPVSHPLHPERTVVTGKPLCQGCAHGLLQG